MNYETMLTNDQKMQVLNNRISQLVIEGYQNSIGLKVANKLGDQEKIEQIQTILDIIKVSLETHIEELNFLIETKTE